MTNWDCCFQSQGHSKIAKCQWIVVQMISYELLNLLLPNMVVWCIVMSQSVFWKDWLKRNKCVVFLHGVRLCSTSGHLHWHLFAVFKVKVTVEDHMIEIWLYAVSSELLILLQLNWVLLHVVISSILVMSGQLCCGQGHGHRKSFKFQLIFVWIIDISSTAKPFVTKLVMVMHHHGPECHTRRLVCYFHGQGHSESSYVIKCDCFYHIDLLKSWSFCYQV